MQIDAAHGAQDKIAAGSGVAGEQPTSDNQLGTELVRYS